MEDKVKIDMESKASSETKESEIVDEKANWPFLNNYNSLKFVACPSCDTHNIFRLNSNTWSCFTCGRDLNEIRKKLEE